MLSMPSWRLRSFALNDDGDDRHGCAYKRCDRREKSWPVSARGLLNDDSVWLPTHHRSIEEAYVMYPA